LRYWEAIASDASIGLSAEIVEKLRGSGLVYGDQRAAMLYLTENDLSLLESYRRKLKRFS